MINSSNGHSYKLVLLTDCITWSSNIEKIDLHCWSRSLIVFGGTICKLKIFHKISWAAYHCRLCTVAIGVDGRRDEHRTGLRTGLVQNATFDCFRHCLVEWTGHRLTCVWRDSTFSVHFVSCLWINRLCFTFPRTFVLAKPACSRWVNRVQWLWW